MSTTYYKKVGRRYYPVAEYDPAVMESLPYGTHLTVVEPGRRSRRYNVDPAAVPLLAASMIFRDYLVNELLEMSKIKPSRKPLTQEQLDAWQRLEESFGDEICTLQSESANQIVELALQRFAEKIKQDFILNPALEEAYNNFLMLYKLSKDFENCQ